MKTAAAAAGEVPQFKCGTREIVKLIVEAQEIQKKRRKSMSTMKKRKSGAHKKKRSSDESGSDSF